MSLFLEIVNVHVYFMCSFFIIVIDFFSCDLSKILVHICKIIRYA
jgi:hypothetical protein